MKSSPVLQARKLAASDILNERTTAEIQITMWGDLTSNRLIEAHWPLAPV